MDIGRRPSAPLVCLGATKQVSPSANVAYQGVVAYTLTLSNSGNLTETAILTDTLPGQVDFGTWVQNAAVQAGNAIAWTGNHARHGAHLHLYGHPHTHRRHPNHQHGFLQRFGAGWQRGSGIHHAVPDGDHRAERREARRRRFAAPGHRRTLPPAA